MQPVPQDINVAQPALSVAQIARGLSIITLIVAFLGIVYRAVRVSKSTVTPKPKMDVGSTLAAFLTAASIPVGFALIAAAFWPPMIPVVTDLPLALAAAGLAIIAVAFKGLHDGT